MEATDNIETDRSTAAETTGETRTYFGRTGRRYVTLLDIFLL